MSLSATWQDLPEQLLQPVLDGHLAMWEAAWLWDEWLMTPEGALRMLPQALWPAAGKLNLLAMEAGEAKH